MSEWISVKERCPKKRGEANQNRITLRWIDREQNAVCDVLSKQVLKDRGVVFSIQPE